MTKEEFLIKKTDNEEIQALTSLDFEARFDGVALLTNFHDSTHQQRLCNLFLTMLIENSVGVLEWFKATATADLEQAKIDLQTELDEINELLG
jgi:hypothetical protein